MLGTIFDENNRKVIIRIKLGETFITSSAIYCKTNQKANIVCLLD